MRMRSNEKSAGDNYELESFFFFLQSSSALKIKNGSYNFHRENTEHLPNHNYHLKIVCVHMLDSVPKHIYFFGICLLVIVVIFLTLLLLVSV